MYDDGSMTIGALPGAFRWIAALLTGSIATSVCVVAIATLGVAMLAGMLPVQRGITVALGCFVLVGAPTLASSITVVVPSMIGHEVAETPMIAPPSVPTAVQPYDPYAGASVPQ